MAVLFNVGLIEYSDVADVADRILSSMDLNGPSECVDSALALCSSLVLQKGLDNASVAAETSERVLNWLFHRWRPSKYDFMS